jgi:hypothetical protein
MKLIVDRFENDFAVCEIEKGKFVNIPIVALDSQTQEGDVIVITTDKSETNKRKEKIDGLMNSLFKD